MRYGYTGDTESTMKLLIAGDRNWSDKEPIKRAIAILERVPCSSNLG
jgi:hypothetical protein